MGDNFRIHRRADALLASTRETCERDMKEIFVLLALITSHTKATSVVHDFVGEKACKSAGKELEEIVILEEMKIRWSCVRKDSLVPIVERTSR